MFYHVKEKDCRCLTESIQIHSDGTHSHRRADLQSLKYYQSDYQLKNDNGQDYDIPKHLLRDDYGEQYCV